MEGVELGGDGGAVRGDRRVELVRTLFVEEGVGELGEVLELRLRRRSCGRGGGRGEGAESEEVVRTARLRALADDRALPTAEGLALHDGARDPAVDVDVARLDPVEPLVDLVRVEGVQARGEAVLRGVLRLDRLVEGVDAHDAEDRAEVLGEVVLAAGLDARADARAPQAVRVVEAARRDLPLLPGLEGREPPEELARGLGGERSHLGGEVIGPGDVEGADRIEELVAHARGEADAADEDHVGRGRALLAGVPEGGVDDVLDGEVEVGRGGDDDGVLARGLGHDPHRRVP